MTVMATVNLIQSKRSQSKAGLAFILSYCKRESKTVYGDKKLIGGVNCIAESAYCEMLSTKMRYGKTDGRMFYHLVQSFSPEENITPETAHEIALKFAEEQFPEYEVLVATHTDKAHIHSHFVINSVSCTNGYKLRPAKDFIEQLRNASDRLCTEYGLSVILTQPKKQTVRQMSSKEYRSAVRGESYKMQLAAVIDDAMAQAKTKKDFIRLMEAEGYGVVWTDERKYITYITQDGKRLRDRSLHEEKYLKGNMEYEFGIRQIILGGTESESAAEYAESRRGKALHNCDRAELERNARYAEDADRTPFPTDEHRRNADYQRGAGGVYEQPARHTDREQRTVSGCGDGVSVGYEESGGELYRLDENGGIGYRETGWEDQRELFERSLNADGQDGALYAQNILDHGYPFGDNGAVLSDAAYLAADITGIIDNDAPVEDCTTRHFPSEHKKKNYGPVMGGM